MCNDFGNHVPCNAYLEAFSELPIRVGFSLAAPNETREDIWPTGKFTLRDQVSAGAGPASWFCFAVIWRPGQGEDGDRFALLTTAPASATQCRAAS